MWPLIVNNKVIRDAKGNGENNADILVAQFLLCMLQLSIHNSISIQDLFLHCMVLASTKGITQIANVAQSANKITEVAIPICAKHEYKQCFQLVFQ